jgi:hypothetical protein
MENNPGMQPPAYRDLQLRLQAGLDALERGERVEATATLQRLRKQLVQPNPKRK